MTKSYKIDPDKLKEILKSKNLKLSEASLEMGYSANALSNVINRGNISGPMKVVLDRVLGISYDDIKTDEIKPEEITENPAPAKNETCEFIITPQISKAQWDLLRMTIKSAVLDAAVSIMEARIKSGEANK